jgi:hypothetical protein
MGKGRQAVPVMITPSRVRRSRALTQPTGNPILLFCIAYIHKKPPLADLLPILGH